MNTRSSRFTFHVSCRASYPRPGKITPVRSSRGEQGIAVIAIIVLLAILLLYIAANVRTLNNLSRELRLLDKAQTRRLQVVPATTNSPSLTNAPAAQLGTSRPTSAATSL